MNAPTAKAIKEIVECIRSHCNPAFPDTFADALEPLLIELAEGIKLDAIEP